MSDQERALELMHQARRSLPVHAVLDVVSRAPDREGYFGQRLIRLKQMGIPGPQFSVEEIWYANPDRWRAESVPAGGGEPFLHVQTERYRCYRRNPDDPYADGVLDGGSFGDAPERSHEIMWDPNALIPELWLTVSGQTVVADRPGMVLMGTHREVSHALVVVPFIASDAFEIVVDDETGVLLRLVARSGDDMVARVEVRKIAFGVELPDELFRLPRAVIIREAPAAVRRVPAPRTKVGHNGTVSEGTLGAVIEVLRRAGAGFAYLFGSRAEGVSRPDSNWDVAAWFGRDVDPVQAAGGLPAGVDLLVLDSAPLELAGRVATRGKLLFEDDPPARVEWEATTRRIWFDEQPRIEQARRDFVEGARRRGRR